MAIPELQCGSENLPRSATEEPLEGDLPTLKASQLTALGAVATPTRIELVSHP